VKVKFKKSFARDLKKRSNDRKLSAKVKRIIGQVDEAENAHQIPNLDDFMFELSQKKYQALRRQSGTLKRGAHSKYLPFAFTEQGVVMLS